MAEHDDILEFWFGPPGSDPFANREKWWKKDPAFDQEIADRFGGLLERAGRGELDAWKEDPKKSIALVILLDQFSRNIHRDDPKMYALDDEAIATVERGIDAGFDRKLVPAERVFYYMPLMHAESLEAQNQCIVMFATLMEETEGSVRERCTENLLFAVKHQKIVLRFGRFPHRNRILGRTSTAEELEFLTQPGSSF